MVGTGYGGLTNYKLHLLQLLQITSVTIITECQFLFGFFVFILYIVVVMFFKQNKRFAEVIECTVRQSGGLRDGA